MPGLLATVRDRFSLIPDSRRQASVQHSMSDTLSSALAMFVLKYPSLLMFDQDARAERTLICHNLLTLFEVSRVPCDTQMRTILDPVKPEQLRPTFRALHSAAQRGGALEQFTWLDGKYLLSIDGTGTFSSTQVHCKHCCEKKAKSTQSDKDGPEFYHQMLVSAIVHPDSKAALPVDFEPITRKDGANKNDSERNAGKRLIPSIKAQYPKRRFVVLEDALAANGPHLELLAKHEMDFIIGVKPGSNAAVFDEVARRMSQGGCTEWEEDSPSANTSRGYRFTNQMPLNASHPDLMVNFIEYWQVDKRGKQTIWSWVTNLTLNTHNALEIVQAGRTRWKIENEVFNTLKNQSYRFEHNYGHGTQYLSSVLGGLMLLAFLIDQLQQIACRLFQRALERWKSKKSAWEKYRAIFFEFRVPDWDTLMDVWAIPQQGPELISVRRKT
ncbi:transposase [Granulosicoccus sp. 3-233]|uniref:transposase n=1 Tax=Granulosicoccus sp. 3-233 TaxID=3417969 RepID=UPI003D351771